MKSNGSQSSGVAGTDHPVDRESTLASGAWATVSVSELMDCDDILIVGTLSVRHSEAGFRSLEADQVSAWRTQCQLLRQVARQILAADPTASAWTIAFEFEIPRRGRRIDAVVLMPEAALVVEFKVGSETFERADLWQAQDYRLDLGDFHEASRGLRIEAVLVATDAPPLELGVAVDRHTGVWRASPSTLSSVMLAIKATAGAAGGAVDPQRWLRSGYRPTPTIIEAARRLFAGHDVRELSHAYADNLSVTTNTIADVIADARAGDRRVLCFVTGVPGAGKTLAGLTAMQDARSDSESAGVAAFMSGNGPLVRVLREALIRDRIAKGNSRAQSAREVELLVQNVHRFIERYGVSNRGETPPEHVIAFDEAQRAWHGAKLAKRHKGLKASEPDLVLDIMARPPKWSVVVALVGGGQEIHDGEAGLEEWGEAVRRVAGKWDVVVSPDVVEGGTSVAGHRLFVTDVSDEVAIKTSSSMHLAVSVRSPRAQRLAEWVNCVMHLDAAGARATTESADGFRLLITRDLEAARRWLRSVATGSLRGGLLASSGAARHRAYGLEVDANFRKGFPFVRWFLDGREDCRSSHFLEVPATDFECQGLELDFTAVCWGDDLTLAAGGQSWTCATLRGSKWKGIRDAQRRQYLVNKYRVLLTRSRDGMVIWVPPGDPNDPSRPPDALDRTAAFLSDCGVQSL